MYYGADISLKDSLGYTALDYINSEEIKLDQQIRKEIKDLLNKKYEKIKDVKETHHFFV